MSNSDPHHASLLYQHSDLPQHQQKQTGKIRKAAVLIPLIRENESWSVLFIRRAENTRDRHSGQVAFPGGRRDSNDNSIIDTALREMHEEIGISATGVQLLGTLPQYLTISDYQITPVVAVLPWPSPITMQTDEVARVFSIPLDWLCDTRNLEVRVEHHPVIYYQKYDNELLWGASARMTLNLSKALDNGSIVLPG